MIAGLMREPAYLQAIIIWRDELNEGKVFLRDTSILKPPMPVRRQGHAGSGDRARSRCL